MDKEAALYYEADIIDRQLRVIRRVLLQAYDADKSRAKLTAPQMQAMAILAQPLRENQAGMTIRDLSEQMRLAQSTVSSLVVRLENKKLVARQTDSSDKRYTRIVLTEKVKSYLVQEGIARRLDPLVSALKQAGPEERKTIVEGLAILSRLITNSSR